MKIIIVAAAMLATAPANAEPTSNTTSNEYELVQTPGPRGMVRWVKKAQPSPKASADGVRYRLEQLPGPRGGTRLVRVSPAGSGKPAPGRSAEMIAGEQRSSVPADPPGDRGATMRGC